MTNDALLDCIVQMKDDLETPLYVYSEEQLDLAVKRFLTLFPDHLQLFYSLKSNPQSGIVSYFANKGIRPEVASGGERRLCLQAGIAPEEILVGGVSKSVRYMTEVCDAGCYGLVIDSPAEWNRLKTVVSGGLHPGVLLRIAPGVPLGGLDMAGSSQFGMSPEQAIGVAHDCNASSAIFQGLHFYFGSQRLSPGPILKTLNIVTETIKAFEAEGLKVQVIDVGLGCGVPYLEKDRALDYDSLREQCRPIWADPVWSGVELWSEAGRALVGHAGYYVSRVTEVKQLYGKTFVFLDGGLNCHNPGVGLGRILRSNPRFLFVDRAGCGSTSPVNIVGNLCTSADLIGQDVAAPKLTEGDLVVIPNSGAYTQTTGMWGFNSQSPFTEMLLEAGGTLRTLEPQYEQWLHAHRTSSSF